MCCPWLQELTAEREREKGLEVKLHKNQLELLKEDRELAKLESDLGKQWHEVLALAPAPP